MRVVLWGAHPRRAVQFGSPRDRHVEAVRDRLADAAKLTLDAALYGASFVGRDGRRVDPRHVATVGPNDLLVLQVERRMSEEDVARLRAQFRAIPDAPRAMILDEGVRLAAHVVEGDTAEAPRPGRCFEDRAFRERWYAERGLTPPPAAPPGVGIPETRGGGRS